MGKAKEKLRITDRIYLERVRPARKAQAKDARAFPVSLPSGTGPTKEHLTADRLSTSYLMQALVEDKLTWKAMLANAYTCVVRCDEDDMLAANLAQLSAFAMAWIEDLEARGAATPSAV